jgi:hypothetical protein
VSFLPFFPSSVTATRTSVNSSQRIQIHVCGIREMGGENRDGNKNM